MNTPLQASVSSDEVLVPHKPTKPVAKRPAAVPIVKPAAKPAPPTKPLTFSRSPIPSRILKRKDLLK
jgi:hypothetical protein